MPRISIPSLPFPYKPLYGWLAAACVLVLLLIYTVVVHFMSGGQERMEQAMLSGQHVEVSLKTGEILGAIHKDEKAKEAAELQAEDKKAMTQHASPEKSQESNTAEAKKPEEEGILLEETPAEDTSGAGEAKEGAATPAATATVEKKEENPDEPFQRREVPRIKVEGEKAYIAIIIQELGLSASSTEGALDLPPEITIGLTPYSTQLGNWIKRADAMGHEVALHIPMETSNFLQNDPGPFALQSSSNADDNVSRLEMMLALAPGYGAIYTSVDEAFSQNLGNMKPLLTALNARDIPLLYGSGYSNITLLQYAESINSRIMATDLQVDDTITQEAIHGKLKDLESVALKNGYAVGYAHAYPLTVQMLTAWSEILKQRQDVVLAPLSAVFKAKSIQQTRQKAQENEEANQ